MRPKANPLPPKGWIKINKGAAFTASRNVQLQFDTSDNSVAVVVSQNPAFAGAVPQAIAPQIPFFLASPVSGIGVATVYARFLDAAGNVSIVYTASIKMDLTADSDGDGLPDAWELAHFGNLTRNGAGDEDHDGVSNLDEFRNGTDPNNALSPLRTFLDIECSNGNATLTWSPPTAILERALTVDLSSPSWTPISPAASPLTVPASNPQEFFRAESARDCGGSWLCQSDLAQRIHDACESVPKLEQHAEHIDP